MPWKTMTNSEGNTTVEIDKDGNPVWIGEDNSTKGIDWSRASSTITKLMSENKQRREENESLLNKTTEITTELDKMKNTPTKKDKNINADEMKNQFETRLTELKKGFEDIIAKKDREVENLLIGSEFAKSEFIKNKTNLPSDLAYLKFGNNFKVKEGKVVPTLNGSEILSQKNLGEIAGFDEAIEIMVNRYQHKDRILKGTRQSGGGTDKNATPSENIYLSDLRTVPDKVKFIDKYGHDAFEKLVAKGKRKGGN